MGILRDKRAYLFFLLPCLFFYLFAVFYPIIQSLELSLSSWNGIGAKKFIGLENYISLLKDQTFFIAFGNNLIYLAIAVTMQLGIGMLFAIMLASLKKAALLKTLYYVPCIITTVAITQLWRSIYATEPIGLINAVLSMLGLEHLATSWLTNIKTVLVMVSIPEGWRFTGMYMIIYYSALISLDTEIIEAARIDGAGRLGLLWRIKIPMIREVIILTLTMALTGSLRGFDIPFLLTNGGPGNVSELMSTYMYKKAFGSNQYGYGSTLAVFIIVESILVITLLHFASHREKVEKR